MKSSTRRQWLTTAFVALSALGAKSAMAQNLSVGDALRRIEAARNGVRTIRASFEMERTMGLFAQTLVTPGVLMVQRPNAIRWELLGNNPGVFVVNGTRVGYRAGGTAQSANQNQVGPLGTILVDLTRFLGGDLQPLQQSYTLSVATNANGRIVLSAVPTNPTVLQSVSRLDLTFSANLQVIEQIDIQEPNNSGRSVVKVSSSQVNVALPANAFTP